MMAYYTLPGQEQTKVRHAIIGIMEDGTKDISTVKAFQAKALESS